MQLHVGEGDIPLKVDKYGVIRVGGTRIPIDTVVGAYWDGATPEEIMQQYPTLKLADIYFSIWYYLHHRSEVDIYLHEREQKGEEARRLYATPVDLQMLRDRLATRESREAKGDT